MTRDEERALVVAVYRPAVDLFRRDMAGLPRTEVETKLDQTMAGMKMVGIAEDIVEDLMTELRAAVVPWSPS